MISEIFFLIFSVFVHQIKNFFRIRVIIHPLQDIPKTSNFYRVTLSSSRCIGTYYTYLKPEEQVLVVGKETGVEVVGGVDRLPDLAFQHQPLNLLPVTHARQLLADLVTGRPGKCFGSL